MNISDNQYSWCLYRLTFMNRNSQVSRAFIHFFMNVSTYLISSICISVTNLFVNSLLVGGIWTLEIHRKYSFIFSEILFKRNSLDINFLLRHLSATIYLNRPIFLTWIFPQSWNDALSQLVSWKNSIFCQTIFNDFRKRN